MFVFKLKQISIAGAFYPNYFKIYDKNEGYDYDKSRQIAGNDLLSTVYYKKFPSGHDGRL